MGGGLAGKTPARLDTTERSSRSYDDSPQVLFPKKNFFFFPKNAYLALRSNARRFVSSEIRSAPFVRSNWSCCVTIRHCYELDWVKSRGPTSVMTCVTDVVK